MDKFFLKLVMAVVLMAITASSVAAYTLKGEVKLTRQGKDFTYQIFLDDEKFCAINQLNPDQKILILGEDLYLINLREKIARHIKSSIDSSQGIRQFLGQPVPANFREYLEKKKAKKTGEESFLSFRCEVYQYTEGEKELQKRYTVYYEPNSGFPLKTVAESDFYGTIIYQFESIGFQKPDPKIFILPDNLRVVEGFEKNSLKKE